MEGLLLQVLCVSERAANIARRCRQERALFELLVEEKQGEAKNTRFRHDFKTLADVLIQETARHHLTKMFPSLCGHVLGEESAEFTNTRGESITVQVCPSEHETATLLERVLDESPTAARLLARAVHEDLPSPRITPEQSQALRAMAVDTTQLGIWIDPIDGTNEYVAGKTEPPGPTGIHGNGLQCVTVLVGAFSRETGDPVLGVVNQPFWREGGGRQVWGVCAGGTSVYSIPPPFGPQRRHEEDRKAITVSSSEVCSTVEELRTAGWEVVPASGAGYKLLCVVDGLADAFLLSKNSAFKWDTCAPHALLRALGGEVVCWRGVVEGRGMSAVRYHVPDEPVLGGGQHWRNEGGILAFRSPKVAHSIAELATSKQ